MKLIMITSATLFLAGCSQQDNRICQPAPSTLVNTSQCIHQQSYLFASANGSIREVANAVVESCNPFLFNDSIKASAELRGGQVFEKIVYDNALKDAVKRVVEARAGKCNAPTKITPLKGTWIEDVSKIKALK